MRHFISFQKRKGLYVPKGTEINVNLAHQINHELMKTGYILSQDMFNRLSTQTEDYLQALYNDLIGGIKNVTGGDGYEPIYRNFPQSVLELSYREFLVNAILHYWTMGTWRPEDGGYVTREFAIEAVDYKEVRLLEKAEFESIFTDIVYSPISISKFDKEVIDWFISQNYEVNLSKIQFKEITAYIGAKLLNDPSREVIPTRDATTILRMWAAYSGGDEGLKENTKFKNPKSKQRKLILNTLNRCTNLEESFKIYREEWLRVLYFLHPMTAGNKKKYPNVAQMTDTLRNHPEKLKTFNSRVESMITVKDIAVLDLLSRRMGTFTRRLDHTVRVFGMVAVEIWANSNPTLIQVVTAYNHFTDRDKQQEGRGAVLASQSKSDVVTYGSLEPLDIDVVAGIKSLLFEKLKTFTNDTLLDKKVYIDRTLYYRPLATNNRASSLSLSSKAVGTVEYVGSGKTVRMYVHWPGGSDIDLSAMIITSKNGVTKVGWNGRHLMSNAVVYSGDNTGYSAKNAEYIDINVASLPVNTEWIILDANVYRGVPYSKWPEEGVRAGWMLRARPESNSHWLPKTLSNSIVIKSDSKMAYLMAFHVPSRNIVYLDVSASTGNVTTAEDAIKMRRYLESMVIIDNGSDEISWDKLNQGHILNALTKEVVKDPKQAEIVFDENTTFEQVAKFLS